MTETERKPTWPLTATAKAQNFADELDTTNYTRRWEDAVHSTYKPVVQPPPKTDRALIDR